MWNQLTEKPDHFGDFIFCTGVFRTLSNISDEAFWKRIINLKAVNFFRKILHLRRLTLFLHHFWQKLHKYSSWKKLPGRGSFLCYQKQKQVSREAAILENKIHTVFVCATVCVSIVYKTNFSFIYNSIHKPHNLKSSTFHFKVKL